MELVIKWDKNNRHLSQTQLFFKHKTVTGDYFYINNAQSSICIDSSFFLRGLW